MRDDLSLLQAQLTYKKRLEAMLAELRAQQEPLQKKAAELEAVMLQEQKDVDRLEGRSLAAFFYNVVGKKDEKLNEERRQAYAARVKYDAVAQELKAIEQDIAFTEEDLADLADCEERYARKIEEKRLAIEAAGNALSAELLEKEKALNDLQIQERELDAAIHAGTAVLRTASEVLNGLRNVENLSYPDRFGNHAQADRAKHEALDEAQKYAQQLQIALQRFNTELADTSIRESMRGSFDRMLKFSDSFFDDLLADTAVPERIRQAHTRVDQVLDQILGILRQLQTKLEGVRHRQVKAKAEMDALIVGMEV